MPRSTTPWSVADDLVLRARVGDGALGFRAIARELGRSVRAVLFRCRRQGIWRKNELGVIIKDAGSLLADTSAPVAEVAKRLGRRSLAACMRGELDGAGTVVVPWTRARARGFDEAACAAAAGAGRGDVLAYMLSAGGHADERSHDAAAGAGDLAAIRTLWQAGVPWDEEVLETAAGAGHLHAVRFLHQSGCPWDLHAFGRAARRGRVEVMEYLLKHGCPWGPGTVRAAVLGNSAEAVRFLVERGCPADHWAAYWAAFHGRLEILACLHEHGLPWEPHRCKRNLLTLGYVARHDKACGDGPCQVRLLRERRFLEVDFRAARRLPEAAPYVVAGLWIVRAAERAMLDPSYLMCRKRLAREFERIRATPEEATPGSHAW